MLSEEQKSTPDAVKRLWSSVERVHKNFAAHRQELGNLFWQLRNLYSDRNSGGVRLTSGHGTFQEECVKRGYNPRRVREWVNDHEIVLGIRKPSESTAAKRKARRESKSSQYDRGYQAAAQDFFVSGAGLSGGLCAEAIARYAALLPVEAWSAAHRAAARLLHPDLGHNTDQMKLLNEAYAALKKHFKSVGETVYEATTVTKAPR